MTLGKALETFLQGRYLIGKQQRQLMEGMNNYEN